MKTESLQAGEDLAARGATAPRVTLDDIKNSVDCVFFATADKLLPDVVEEGQNTAPLRILTLCVVVLKNGFVLLGKSAPADPTNFDADKGKEFAYEDALRQAWPLMGYALRDRLHRENEPDYAAADLVGSDEVDEPVSAATAGDFGGVDPTIIPDDETLEGLLDTPVKDLALAHGVDYVDRADAIAKLKARRDSLTPKPA